jgi:hypothetical protein
MEKSFEALIERIMADPKPTQEERKIMEKWGFSEKHIELVMRNYEPSREQLKALLAKPLSEWTEVRELNHFGDWCHPVLLRTEHDGYAWHAVGNEMQGKLIGIEPHTIIAVIEE